MEIAFPTIFIVLFFIGMWWIMHSHYRREDAKRALPQREIYASQHGGGAAACHRCAGAELKDEGLDSGADSKRIVSCARCKTLLYRYQRAEAATEAS